MTSHNFHGGKEQKPVESVPVFMQEMEKSPIKYVGSAL